MLCLFLCMYVHISMTYSISNSMLPYKLFYDINIQISNFRGKHVFMFQISNGKEKMYWFYAKTVIVMLEIQISIFSAIK